jgi:ABC-type phosphate/phosphonate transport system ATPase subunit
LSTHGCSFDLRSATLSFADRVALQSVSISIQAGERVALVGPSGAGKTSLLRLLGAAVAPTQGTMLLDGRDLAQLTNQQLRTERARLGFVHQDYALVPNMRALQNVLMGRLGTQSVFAAVRSVFWPSTAEESAVHALLQRVGIGDRLYHRVDTLSGGERQRVAIARALATQPSILMGDEPTGNLDSRTSREVIDLFRRLNADQNLTVILVTHDLAVAKNARRNIVLRDGKIIADTSDHAAAEIALKQSQELA